MILNERRSLLSSQARVQVPWIKVTIGDFSFGVYERKNSEKNSSGTYKSYKSQFPNYIKNLNITKINGQINQYSLTIVYPITQNDDPNFFEKVFSSVSNTRKIIFSYGDAATPSFVYKNEEAIITKINTTFNLSSSTIQYVVNAVSSASLATSGSYTFPSDGIKHKPSDIIKKLFKSPIYKLSDIFTGMAIQNLDTLIAGDDEAVIIEPKRNISILDYITYLTSCMIPQGTTTETNITNDIYILTVHDETMYDTVYGEADFNGPYFKVTRTSYLSEQSDAYVIDVGYNTSTIVTNFDLVDGENYSIFYDYQNKLHPEHYVNRINQNGQWESVYAPANTTTDGIETEATDRTWWTKITKYPITANITIQGLLRPAMLMTHVRLNIIFPGGHKHIASGLYIVTKQQDTISSSGYRTTLSLTRISGDNSMELNGSVEIN